MMELDFAEAGSGERRKHFERRSSCLLAEVEPRMLRWTSHAVVVACGQRPVASRPFRHEGVGPIVARLEVIGHQQDDVCGMTCSKERAGSDGRPPNQIVEQEYLILPR